MNKFNSVFELGVLLLLFMSSAMGQSSEAFIKAEGSDESSVPSSFSFSTSNYRYKISNEGQGRRSRENLATQTFKLRLGTGGNIIERVYYAEFQDDILLICEDTDGEGSAGFITRLNQRTLKAKWWRAIPTFNIGQGLIEGKFAYVTALGFVGKISLNTGAYVWRYGDLYRDGAFNSFEIPEIEGEVVVFTEKPVNGNQAATSIRIQKLSGRILRRK